MLGGVASPQGLVRRPPRPPPHHPPSHGPARAAQGPWGGGARDQLASGGGEHLQSLLGAGCSLLTEGRAGGRKEGDGTEQ